MTLNPPEPDAVVVDTNVALDWLVFRKPSVTPLFEQIAAGRLRWLGCDRMRDELAHVLSRGLGGRLGDQPAEPVVQAWCSHVRMQPAPVPGATQRLHCTDPDDQVFIDAAVVWQARWLVTRDRALLRLAKRARRWGVEVLTPERCLAVLP